MPVTNPSAAFSLKLRVKLPAKPGMFGRLATALGEAGGDLGHVGVVSETRKEVVRDIVVACRDLAHEKSVAAAARKVAEVEVLAVEDTTFVLHEGGKIATLLRQPLTCPADLARAYTPGVARVCNAIAARPELSHAYTIRRNMVAVVSDGTAVLGLGDIGPLGAMPVMEGKAMLFKEFGGVDAFPICLDTKDPEEIIRAVKQLAPTFGGINLEDISAPRCFQIEDRLKAELDIPVFHDDQHGTAIVALAALLSALKIVGKKMADLRVVVCGVGAAGVACSKILLAAGVRNIVGCDRQGAIYKGRSGNMNFMKDWYAEHTNPEKLQGNLDSAMRGADVFLGVSGPGALSADAVKTMAKKAIVMAMSNPVPEIMPEEAGPHVAIMATGRSDYPNQINNVLAFPGVFRGALDCYARAITEGMKVAAAEAIASLVSPSELRPDYIVPTAFDRRVGAAVAQAVRECAVREGVARPHLGAAPGFEDLTW
jgi:malate dehydrogenase (oxaloacetate-decarboxylating)